MRAVFIDLQKTFDTAYKHGILIDLYGAGFRGQLPLFTSKFLKYRVSKVKLGQIFSSQGPQCAGITQLSTLSVTLFALRINSISDVIPRDVFASMYVDDAQISFAHSDTGVISARLQSTVDIASLGGRRVMDLLFHRARL